MYYVYILKTDKKHYIGHTNNIIRRLQEHTSHKNISTKHYNSIQLIWYFEKGTRQEAMILESKIKKNGHIDHRINHPTFIACGYISIG